jgi:hypothetical protein
MKKFIRPIIALIVIVLSFLVSYGVLWTIPKPVKADSESFSAMRVAGNFSSIDSTGSFLANRLVEAGGIPMQLDSNGKRGIAFDFPAKDSAAPRLLLAARSRADASIEAEILTQALRYRDLWNQGLRLFLQNDSTELADNPVFENVGLAICIDAGASRGAALLYRTSSGNDSIMKLFSGSWHIRTHTLFNAFDGADPTDRNFNSIAAAVPATLFTDEGTLGASKGEMICDAAELGALNTIQHYGSQIDPMVKEYLTGKEYGSVKALESGSHCTAFTNSSSTLVAFSKGQMNLYNSITLLLFCLAFCMAIIRGRLKPANAIRETGIILLATVLASLAGYCIFKFGWIDPAGPKASLAMQVIFYATIAICAIVYIIMRGKAARKASSHSLRTNAKSSGTAAYSYSVLYGDMILCVALAAVAFFTIKDDIFLTEPLICAVSGIILWRVTKLRLFLITSVAGILLYIIPLLTAYSAVVNNVAAAAVAPVAVCCAFLLITLTDLYVRRDKAV